MSKRVRYPEPLRFCPRRPHPRPGVADPAVRGWRAGGIPRRPQSGGRHSLPARLLVVPWDPTDTRLGPVTVSESTAESPIDPGTGEPFPSLEATALAQ